MLDLICTTDIYSAVDRIVRPIRLADSLMLAQATNQLAAAQERYNVAQGKGLAGQFAKWAMNHAKWMIKAANATTLFGRGMKQIVAFFAGGGWLSLLITGLSPQKQCKSS